jgi:hypothetical protein
VEVNGERHEVSIYHGARKSQWCGWLHGPER